MCVHAGCSALARVAACVRLHVWLLVGCIYVGAHRVCRAEQSSVRAGVHLWGGAYAVYLCIAVCGRNTCTVTGT